MQFLKYHALGNDYLVLQNELFGEQTPDWAVEPDPDAVIRICDRNRGLGSDGILVGEKMAEAASDVYKRQAYFRPQSVGP